MFIRNVLCRFWAMFELITLDALGLFELEPDPTLEFN